MGATVMTGGVGSRGLAPSLDRRGGWVIVDSNVVPPLHGVSGTVAPNSAITLGLGAAPGSLTVLLLGDRLTMKSLEPFGVGHLFCIPIVTFGQFRVPASGQLDIPVTLPAGWPVDVPFCTQFLTIEPAPNYTIWASNAVMLLAKSRV
ncbi:MAG: hypothetical protein KDC95_01890 [Planctomycetes bacterium]|nr:hypothetical protein [Planctomycetota bacterium]